MTGRQRGGRDDTREKRLPLHWAEASSERALLMEEDANKKEGAVVPALLLLEVEGGGRLGGGLSRVAEVLVDHIQRSPSVQRFEDSPRRE